MQRMWCNWLLLTITNLHTCLRRLMLSIDLEAEISTCSISITPLTSVGQSLTTIPTPESRLQEKEAFDCRSHLTRLHVRSNDRGIVAFIMSCCGSIWRTLNGSPAQLTLGLFTYCMDFLKHKQVLVLCIRFPLTVRRLPLDWKRHAWS